MLTVWNNVWFFSLSQYFRESILSDIRKARNLYTGKELAAELARIRQRIDNIEILTADIVINLLLSYRDIQVRRYFTVKSVMEYVGRIRGCQCHISPAVCSFLLILLNFLSCCDFMVKEDSWEITISDCTRFSW